MDTICWALYVLYETKYVLFFPFIYLYVCTCLWLNCAISHSHANKDQLNWIELNWESGRQKERDVCKCQVHQLLMDSGWQQLLTLGGESRLLSSTVETVNSQDRVSTDTCIKNTTLLSASLAALKKLSTHTYSYFTAKTCPLWVSSVLATCRRVGTLHTRTFVFQSICCRIACPEATQVSLDHPTQLILLARS